MDWKFALGVAAASVMVASAAAPPAATRSPPDPTAEPKRQCFWTRDVTNFASDDNRIVNIRVGVKDIYQFEMFGLCPEVDWNEHITIVSRGGSSQICSGLDADIISPSSIGPQRCPVRHIRKLTPAEVEALPKRARP